jgi:hypothetical protein
VCLLAASVRLPFETQHNILQADFPRAASRNTLIMKPKALLDALSGFTGEMSLIIEPTDPAAAAEALDGPPVPRIRMRTSDTNIEARSEHGGKLMLKDAVNAEADVPKASVDKFSVRTTSERMRAPCEATRTARAEPQFAPRRLLMPLTSTRS